MSRIDRFIMNRRQQPVDLRPWAVELLSVRPDCL